MDVDTQSLTFQGYVRGYLVSCGITVLYLDYLTTLPEEIRLIWPRRRSRSALLFFLNRYPPILGDAVIALFNFSHFSDTVSTCRTFGLWRQGLLIFNQCVVGVLLVLRISVLYRDMSLIRFSIWAIALTLVGVACWSVVGQSGTVVQNPLVEGCHIALSREVGIRTAIAWEAQAAFDVMAVGLTAYASWRTRREAFASSSMILSTLYRDGAVYFVIMASALLANIFTFIFSPPLLKGVLSTLASSVSVSMMSRLVLRLHDAALRLPSSTLIGRTAIQLPSVGMVFATRLELVEDEVAGEETAQDGYNTQYVFPHD